MNETVLIILFRENDSGKDFLEHISFQKQKLIIKFSLRNWGGLQFYKHMIDRDLGIVQYCKLLNVNKKSRTTTKKKSQKTNKMNEEIKRPPAGQPTSLKEMHFRQPASRRYDKY